MNKFIKGVIDEVRSFLNGKTIDALIPPLVYVISSNFVKLKVSIMLSLGVALAFAIYRIFKRDKIIYALGGVLSVVVASGFALFADNAANYFLPKVLGSAGLLIISVVSILIGRPIAAILSHLSRGWRFDWYLRRDIKPAYREVSIAWVILVAVRLSLQWLFYQRGNVVELGWASIVLGFPMTLVVLVLTLVYGLWRLKNLGGPGIEEYEAGKNPPWEGQTKGF